MGDLPPFLTHEGYLCILKDLEVGEVCRVFWLRWSMLQLPELLKYPPELIFD
jgi:hypothetical protein